MRKRKKIFLPHASPLCWTFVVPVMQCFYFFFSCFVSFTLIGTCLSTGIFLYDFYLVVVFYSLVCSYFLSWQGEDDLMRWLMMDLIDRTNVELSLFDFFKENSRFFVFPLSVRSRLSFRVNSYSKGSRRVMTWYDMTWHDVLLLQKQGRAHVFLFTVESWSLKAILIIYMVS